jgi:hypothetical protein
MPSGFCAGIASEVSAPDNTTPADRLLELFVFAPAGLALTIAEELPSLVEKGRNRIEGRTATARVIGQFAVQMGCREVMKRARQLVSPDPPTHRADPVTWVAEPHSGYEDSAPFTVYPVTDYPETSEQCDRDDVETEHQEVNGYAALADLAIPAYDTLSASQVVKRLAGLSREELLEVGDHERQNRHRATILTKVEQLLSGEPSLGV